MSEVAEAPAKKRARKKKEETSQVEVVTVSVPAEVIDWKKQIPDEFIQIQQNWFLKNGINPNTLTAEEKKELKERAGDENLMILLGGFKHIAHQRGIKELDYDVLALTDDRVSAKCTIAFKDGEVYRGMANASKENTGYPFNMFLESMAENRSFCRACRSAFNINILGAEELNPTTAEFSQDTLLSDDEGCTSPQESLRILLEGKGKTFADLKQSLLKKSWDGADAWNDFKEVPSDQCLLIISTIQSKPAKG